MRVPYPKRPHLKKLREERGISMQELADRVGVSVAHLKNLEEGWNHLSPACQSLLEQTLSVPEGTLADPPENTRREVLLQNISQAPAAIAQTEMGVVEAKGTLTALENALKDQEANLRMSGRIEGTNEKLRDAQVRLLTADKREAVMAAELMVDRAKLAHHRALNEFAAAMMLARILGGEEQ